MATGETTEKPYVPAAGAPVAVITAAHPSVAARTTPTQASTRSRRTRSDIVARNGASSAAGAMRAAVTAPTAATAPSRNATTASATMNALSPAHIAANEVWARRSGPLCATWPSAPAQARSLGETRTTTTRLSQRAPSPGRGQAVRRGETLQALPRRFRTPFPKYWSPPVMAAVRFGSGPVRMGAARLERATSCL
jgi:hypothetical protein